MIKNLFEKAPQEKGPFQYLVAVWDSSKRGFSCYLHFARAEDIRLKSALKGLVY
jgi:hypothetical protein